MGPESGIVSHLTPLPCTEPHHRKEDFPHQANTESPTSYNLTGEPRQRNMAQMKEQMKTSEKELIIEEIANLSDAELKTLVIRKLTEVIEYKCKIKEEVIGIPSEIKKNAQGTNSEKKGTRTQINDLYQNEEKHSTGTE